MDELKCYGKNIYVNDYEKGVLDKCHIDVTKLKDMDELVWLIDKFLSECDDDIYDEVDYVASLVSERKYYMGKK